MGVIDTYSAGFHVADGVLEGERDEKWDERISLAPLMATLLLPILIGAIIVIKCVFGHCCVRKTNTKEEMYGVEGRMTMLAHSDAAFLTPPASSSAATSCEPVIVASPGQTQLLAVNDQNKEKLKSPTITNAKPPHNNNHLDVPIAISKEIQPIGVDLPPTHRSDCDISDSLRRTTGKRQLPDLPELPQHSLGHPPRRSSSVLSHDGTSELYATVGDAPNLYAHLKTRHSVPNDVCQPSTSRGRGGKQEYSGVQKNSLEPNPSSDSETYASSNHPYAKLKRNSSEHPYARVRNPSINDEETDTDNYDMPQPYAQSRSRPGGNVNVPQNSTTTTASGGSNTAQGPVPPRRIGRQWRRGSQPQTQANADSASHFSGDSQDSRGYTSISVREPLSNIRSQIPGGRNGDSHYATVSDDSEEMYAAIDDTSVDGNYMQIPEGERPCRPSWLDAANVASPIPRREANSPLPPVPAVPPPGSDCTIPTTSPVSPALVPPPPQTPPVYAQVTKKTKKNKAPVIPTTSNASTSSQQTLGRDHETGIQDNTSVVPGPSSSSSTSTHHSHHHQHHRSKSRTLMDNTNLLESNISEHRRWSKADISYSEFEVVRETHLPAPPFDLKKSPVTFTLSSSERQQYHGPVSPRDSISSHQSISQEFVDEDNYNVIPDKREKISRSQINRSGGSDERNRLDSDNYQEIEPISNTYQEIGKQPSDHYQEIGLNTSSALKNGMDDDDDQDDSGSGLYQVIRKSQDDVDEFEEEDEEDQFYEKVRTTSVASNLTVPVHTHTGRKHGYDQIKRKIKSPNKDKVGTSEDEEEEDDERLAEDDLMYEKVKYPPYERLKESRSDLTVDANVDDDEGSNFYEDIGYSRVKPKNKTNASANNTVLPAAATGVSAPAEEAAVDLNQLYAVIDKTKKKGKTTSCNASTNNNNPQNSNNNNPILDNNLSSSSASSSPYHNSSPRFSSSSINSVHKISIKKGELTLHAGPELDFIDDNNDIEYI